MFRHKLLEALRKSGCKKLEKMWEHAMKEIKSGHQQNPQTQNQ